MFLRFAFCPILILTVCIYKSKLIQIHLSVCSTFSVVFVEFVLYNIIKKRLQLILLGFTHLITVYEYFTKMVINSD